MPIRYSVRCIGVEVGLGTRVTSVGEPNASGASGGNNHLESIRESVGDGNRLSDDTDGRSINGLPCIQCRTSSGADLLERSVLEYCVGIFKLCNRGIRRVCLHSA